MQGSRKTWNARHKELRRLLASPAHQAQAIALFLQHHAEVHAKALLAESGVSFQDEALAGMSADQLRMVPEGMDHSIAWIVWHLARIEDVTMSVLVAGEPQVYLEEGWFERQGVGIKHTGNLMVPDSVEAFSQAVVIESVLGYRLAVGRNTARIAGELAQEQVQLRIDPARLQLLREQGAVIPAADDLLAYWGRRTVGGLLLMPATRHSFLHLNQAGRIRSRLLPDA